jgi:hypothetical protein
VVVVVAPTGSTAEVNVTASTAAVDHAVVALAGSHAPWLQGMKRRRKRRRKGRRRRR